jgi:hypothetical protein
LKSPFYFPRIISIPDSINCSLTRGNRLTRVVRRSLSTLMIWETFATDSLGRPVTRAGRERLPGAPAHFRLLVKGTQTTVATRLRFTESHWTTTTGLRYPGPEPTGSGRSAHQTSPWEITIRCASERGGRRWKRRDLAFLPQRRRRDSSLWLSLRKSGGPHTPAVRR